MQGSSNLALGNKTLNVLIAEKISTEALFSLNNLLLGVE